MLKKYATSIAIVVAGALLAGGLYFGGATAKNLPTNTNGGHNRGTTVAEPQPSDAFRLPNDTDHVRGNPDAKVTIVEFSDFECPFCSRFHPTLKRITDENRDVKWVYRHFPLSSIHSRALGAAVAAECVAKLGGNDAFWAFADAAFANQNQLSASFYEELATTAGVGVPAFKACLSDKSIAALVTEDGDEAVQAGGRGTPFAVVITASGRLVPFSGALPYEQVQGLVDQALTN